jgi:phospholipase/carboxylesterase
MDFDMTTFPKLCLIWAVASMLVMSAPAIAQDSSFPMRETPRSETTHGVPHVQIDVQAIPELSEEMLRQVAEFPGVVLGATRVSLPGAVGLQLAGDVFIAQPQAILGGREFAHLHPDGSLHASLLPDTAQAAIDAGWAVAHPWADQRAGWEGSVMIHTPITEAELDVVLQLVRGSYTFITGELTPETEKRLHRQFYGFWGSRHFSGRKPGQFSLPHLESTELRHWEAQCGL